MLFSIVNSVLGPYFGLKLGRLKAMLASDLLSSMLGFAMIFFGARNIYIFIALNIASNVARSLKSNVS
ncbi:MAG: hypothetical protein FWG30_09430 [Eubacteriaceae bacterium]|nr:hypothetical protein [Eubacteriaceae bacterium]